VVEGRGEIESLTGLFDGRLGGASSRAVKSGVEPPHSKWNVTR
jgi:hypothetical protein